MRAFAVTLLAELATACFAITGLYAIAWSIRLAFGLQFGHLALLGLGFAVLGWVAHTATRYFAPPKPAPGPLTFMGVADMQKMVAALDAELRRHERQVL